MSLESISIKYVKYIYKICKVSQALGKSMSLRDLQRKPEGWAQEHLHHRPSTLQNTLNARPFTHPVLQRNMHFTGLSLPFSCEPNATFSCTSFFRRVE